MPAMPGRLEVLCGAFGICGYIAIECSPLLEDNDWLLRVADAHPFVLGVIGNLDPGDPAYSRHLDKFRENPLFLGIRYGNLWDRDLLADLKKPRFIEGIRFLADSGLVFESANTDPKLIRALLEIVTTIPHLRVVLDHIPNAKLSTDARAVKAFHDDLAALAKNPLIYVKLSEIPVASEGALISRPEYYRDKLDPLWDLFGPDRVIFGSDWPNSDQVASYAQTFAIVSAYLGSKSAEAREAYFSKNSELAYRWSRRSAE